MTASQRLKMLESFTNPRHGPLPSWWLDSMVAALPQLVAVVKAAEGTVTVFRPEHKLCRALAALDEALPGRGEGE